MSVTNCCLGGILYFKQLIIQIRHFYPHFSFLKELDMGMSKEAELKAVEAISALSTAETPKETDIKSIVQMCLVKMGDLAR